MRPELEGWRKAAGMVIRPPEGRHGSEGRVNMNRQGSSPVSLSTVLWVRESWAPGGLSHGSCLLTMAIKPHSFQSQGLVNTCAMIQLFLYLELPNAYNESEGRYERWKAFVTLPWHHGKALNLAQSLDCDGRDGHSSNGLQPMTPWVIPPACLDDSDLEVCHLLGVSFQRTWTTKYRGAQKALY